MLRHSLAMKNSQDAVRDFDDKIAKIKDGESLTCHLVGVAGSGMSGLARLLLDMGARVFGSDKNMNNETVRLTARGLNFRCPHPEELDAEVEFVIYSSAISKENPALRYALAKGLRTLRRAEALSVIASRKKASVVAGCHGKTTTTSMIAHALETASKNASYYIGAEIPLLRENARWQDDGELFVAEGDESDGTLILYAPEIALLLNIEEEHLDFYKDGLPAILKVYKSFLDNVRSKIIYCRDDKYAHEICQDRQNAISYGFAKEANFRGDIIAGANKHNAGAKFTIIHNGKKLGKLELNIPGKHNILNAIGACATLINMGVNFDQVVESMKSFRGARRRFERKFFGKNFSVIDDYGHHPTEIKATLETANDLQPRRLICMFQPHRYTRTLRLQKEFATSFDLVDALFVSGVYAASETALPGVDGALVCQAVRSHIKKKKLRKPRVFHDENLDELRLLAGNFLQAGDMIITLGAGNIHQCADILTRHLTRLEILREALGEKDCVCKLYEPMARHCTLRVGGRAQYWAEPKTIAGFARLIKSARELALPTRVIGRGSNLIVRDGGLRGLAIRPKGGEFEILTIDKKSKIIEAGAGVSLRRLANFAKDNGIGGFEWMEGIPGCVGGSLRMNAGAMLGECSQFLASVTLVADSGKVEVRKGSDLDARYRGIEDLKNNYVASACFSYNNDDFDIAEIARKMRALADRRRSSQPKLPSAGCMFKNPASIPAGKLIDELGFKGKRRGGAMISLEHGNFVVNVGNASSEDILGLMREVKSEAMAKRGIELEFEAHVIGDAQRDW